MPASAPPATRRPGVAALALAALVGAAGCSPTDPRVLDPTAAVTVATASGPLALVQGEGGTLTLALERVDTDAPVTLAVDGAPPGISVALPPGALAGSARTVTLTVSVAADVPPGSYAFGVTASAPRARSSTARIAVTVAATSAPVIGLTTTGAGGLTVAQGRTATVAVAVSRGGGFAGNVTLTADALPAGVTATLAPAVVAAGSGAAQLVLAASASAAAGNATVTLRARGPGGTPVAATTIPLVVTAGGAPSAGGGYALDLPSSAVSTQQGASVAPVAVAITRAGGFTGPVTLAATNVPAGLTVIVPQAPVTGSSATVMVGAAGTMAAGDYSVALRGTAAGLADVTATLVVRVTAVPLTGSAVTWTFCPPAEQQPVWLAVQNEGGAWARVAPEVLGSDQRFTFLIGTRGGVAWVTRGTSAVAPEPRLTVIYGTTAELRTLGATQCNYMPSGGSRELTGTVAGLGTTDQAVVTVGAASTSVFAPSSASWSLRGVPAGPQTLVASRLNGGTLTPDRLIVRRNAQFPASGAVPVLDFAAREAVVPATGKLTVANGGGDLLTVTTALQGQLLGAGVFAVTSSTGGTNALTYAGLPDSLLAAGELHELTAVAQTSDGAGARVATVYARGIGDRALTLGAGLPAATVTMGPGVPLRASVGAVADYPTLMLLFAQQAMAPGTRTIVLSTSAAYAGTAPATWTATLPDLTGVTGFDASWAPAGGVRLDWAVSLFAGPPDLLLGVLPFEGRSYRRATRYGSLGGSVAARLAPDVVARLRP